MLPSHVDRALRQFQRRRDPAALAVVFDHTAPELLALARHLCRGSTVGAEDVLQETFLTALERIDQYDPARRALPWLLGILTNRARAARRRHARDEASGGAIACRTTRSPEAAAVASELQDAVASAIERLPAPYRPVLRLHLERGMNAAEIAVTLERPAGTVRAQISRGLDALRRHLPAALAAGSTVTALAPVRAAVLRALPDGSPGSALPLTTSAFGAIVMVHKPLLAAAVALVLVVAFAVATRPVWLGTAPPREPAAPAFAGIEVPRGGPRAPTSDPARKPVADAPDLAGEPMRAGEPDAKTENSVTITVRPFDDPTGTVAGIGVSLAPLSTMLDMGRQPRFVATDENGRVTFDGLSPEPHFARLDRCERRGRVEIHPEGHKHVDLPLPPGVNTWGVVRHADGQPAGGATIWLHGNHTGSTRVGIADANGAFAIEDIEPNLLVQARLPGDQPGLCRRVDGAPGSRLELDLTLSGRARSLRGRVIDPTGRPVPFAALLAMGARQEVEIRDGSQSQLRPLYLRADAAGEFASTELPNDVVTFLARGSSPSLAPGTATIDLTRDATGWCEISLSRAATLEGRVTRAGHPLSGASIRVYCNEASQWANVLGMRIAMTDAEGRFRVEGLLPGDSQLHAYLGPTSLARAELRMEAGATRSWERDLDDDPATLCHVRIDPPLDPVTRRPWRIEVTDGHSTIGLAELEHGEASVRIRASAGRTWIQVTRIVPSLSQRVVVHTADAHPGSPQTIVVPEARLAAFPLRARLLSHDFTPIANRSVSLRWLGEPSWSLDLGTDDEGLLMVESMPPGGYRIVAWAGGAERISDPIFVRSSEPGAAPRDVRLAPPGR